MQRQCSAVQCVRQHMKCVHACLQTPMHPHVYTRERALTPLLAATLACRDISIDLGAEIRSQNKMLEGMEDDFDSTSGFMSGTMQKLTEMVNTGGSKHMCYLIGFIFSVFFIVYWMIS